MPATSDLTDALEETLPDIDRHLADEDVPLAQRPMSAAILFVKHFVLEVQEPQKDAAVPGPVGDFISTPWFAKVYSHMMDRIETASVRPLSAIKTTGFSNSSRSRVRPSPYVSQRYGGVRVKLIRPSGSTFLTASATTNAR